jgi:hypothetical protein
MSSSPSRIYQQSSNALETPKCKVDMQTKLWHIGQRLLEYCAGVLGVVLAEAEPSQEDSGSATPDTDSLRIPLSSMSSLAHRFDGAHHFSRHDSEGESQSSLACGAAPGSSNTSRRLRELEELEVKAAVPATGTGC